MGKSARKKIICLGWLGGIGRAAGILVGFLAVAGAPARAQQFNSDNYWTTPKGMGTVIVTVGQRHTLFLDTFSLLKRWEFSLGGTAFRENEDLDRAAYYQLTTYAKYTIFENQAKNGGRLSSSAQGPGRAITRCLISPKI